MMTSRFLRLFQLWLLASLKTSPYRLHFVPLFLKLFCLCKFRLPFFLNFVRLLFTTAFVVPDILLRVGVPRLVSGLGMSFLFLCLFGFEVLRGSRACSVGVLYFLLLFPFLTLRISMGLGRSSVLCIGSNPAKASSSGRTGGESDSLAVVVH